jgi:putative membrane protein insertion efficiency factor
MKHVMIWLVSLYRKIISPIKPPCCRFTPTCSAYAIVAFRKRGFFAGMILTVWRILRCNPFSKGGYDPVPDKGFKPYGKKEGTPEGEIDGSISDTADEKKQEKENKDNV